jgi:hypothetical protein
LVFHFSIQRVLISSSRLWGKFFIIYFDVVYDIFQLGNKM